MEFFEVGVWGGKRESNPQPPEPQSGALPVELFPPQKTHYSKQGDASFRTLTSILPSPNIGCRFADFRRKKKVDRTSERCSRWPRNHSH